jgi:hypothetical protein
MFRLIKRERQRSFWNNMLLAVSAPMFVAYGDRDNPFGRNNLILGGSLLGALAIDDVAEQLFSKGKNASAWGTGAQAWSIGATIAYPLVTHFALKDEQHERFVIGTADFEANAGTSDVELSTLLSKKGLEQIKKVKNPLVVGDGVSLSEITDGKLRLTRPAVASKGKVTFILDTQAPA